MLAQALYRMAAPPKAAPAKTTAPAQRACEGMLAAPAPPLVAALDAAPATLVAPLTPVERTEVAPDATAI